MELTIGILIGITISILNFVLINLFKNPIDKHIEIITKQITNKGPRKKGYVIDPEPEIELKRKEILEKNSKEGKDTRLSDLM